MAWNQSHESRTTKSKGPSKSAWRGALAALLVVLGAGGVLMWLIPGRTSPALTKKCPEPRLSEVSPSTDRHEKGAATGKPAKTEMADMVPSVATNSDDAVGVTNSAAKTSGAKSFRLVKQKKKRLFHTMADVCISRVIGIKPGHPIIGTMNYDRFPELLKKALATPITFDKNDTDEDKELKQAVIETRKELKEAMDRGEDVAQIMRESEQELRRLYQYRASLSKDLAAAMREKKFSAVDMQDYVDAANKMLKDNGLEPLKHPQLWIRNLKLRESQPAKGK